MFETTNHLLMGCNFSEAVWNLVAARFNMSVYKRGEETKVGCHFHGLVDDLEGEESQNL
jgi:hypothetical protein